MASHRNPREDTSQRMEVTNHREETVMRTKLVGPTSRTSQCKMPTDLAPL